MLQYLTTIQASELTFVARPVVNFWVVLAQKTLPVIFLGRSSIISGMMGCGILALFVLRIVISVTSLTHIPETHQRLRAEVRFPPRAGLVWDFNQLCNPDIGR